MKLQRPPRSDDPEDWKDWVEEVERTMNTLIDDTDAYTPTNVTPTNTYDADATTVDELADVLGTLIAELQAKGLIS